MNLLKLHTAVTPQSEVEQMPDTQILAHRRYNSGKLGEGLVKLLFKNRCPPRIV